MRNIYIEKVSKICPHCGKLFEGNHASYANHVRWCKDNPDRESMLKHMSNKLKNHEHKPRIERGTFIVTCHKCGKEFEVIEPINKFPLKERYYCCRSCANSRVKTDEIKQKTSESVNKYLTSNNLHIKKYKYICKECGAEFEDTNKNRIFCSNECRIKFNKKYSICPAAKRYRDACSFRFYTWQFPDEFDLDLIKQYGWYKSKNMGNNLSGVSRDHMISIKYGYDNHIDPYLISHPANCKLLLHSENMKKNIKCSLTIDELITRVKNWNKIYGEYPNNIDYEYLSLCGYNINIRME